MKRHALLLFLFIVLHTTAFAQEWLNMWFPLHLDSNVHLQLPARPIKKMDKLFPADKTVGTICNDQFYLASYNNIENVSHDIQPLLDSFINAGYSKKAATDSVRQILYDEYIYQECTAAGRQTSQQILTIDSVLARTYIFVKTKGDDILHVVKLLVYSNHRLYIFENMYPEKSNPTSWRKMVSSIRITNKF